MREVVETDVIVCGLIPYGDDDLVVRLFSRRLGRLGAFARAAKKSRKRFAGLVAPSLGTAALRPRSGDLWDLAEIDVDGRLFALGSDLRAYGFAAYVLELLERFVPEGAPQPDLFALIEDTLLALASRGPRPAVLRCFELHLLHDLGVLPDLTTVADEPGAPSEAYDPVQGHLLAHGSPAALPFPDEARLLALHLLARRPGEVEGFAEAPLRVVARVFASWLRRQGGAPLKSLGFLRSLDEKGAQSRLAGDEPEG